MAARFAECSNKLIENLKEKSKNKNTTVSTNNWLKVWKTWAKQAGHSDEIKSYKPEELNVLLEEFFRAHFLRECILLTSNQMFFSCNSGLISTRKYFKDHKLNSLRSFNFMLVFEIFTCAD